MQTAARKTTCPAMDDSLKLVAAWDKITVRELAMKDPRVRKMLESIGIDTCCGGGMKLKAAAEAACVKQEKIADAVRRSFDETKIPGENESAWLRRSDRELILHIVKVYHKYLHENMPQFEIWFNRVIKAHVAHAKELKQVFGLYKSFMTDMIPHLKKEEEVVFPAILSGGTASMELRRLIRELEAEHTNVGNLLKEIGTITFHYRIPVYACPTMQMLYNGLREMDVQTHEHIYLENNILFPRVII
ncbi:MAG: DUF542 domain-containing protein [Victivallales bacterium]